MRFAYSAAAGDSALPVTARVLGRNRTAARISDAAPASTRNRIENPHVAWIPAIRGTAVALTENVMM